MKNILPFILFFWVTNIAIAQQTVGLFLNDAFAENGYTLYTVDTKAYLIDNCGFVVNEWESEYRPGLSLYLLENGNLLRTGRVSGSFSGGGIGGRLELFNWEGDLLWAYNYASQTYHQHHDIEPLPNGNILILAWELQTNAAAVQAGRNPNETPNNGVWPTRIVEVEMIGTNEINVVWECHLWDHLIQDFDSSKDNYGVIADHPELVDANYAAFANNGPGDSGSDWVHCNAIGYNADLDQIVLSSRHFSEIWIIDHSTTSAEAAGHSGGNAGKGGDLLYRFGNPKVYDRGNDFDQVLFGQHDVKWVPAGYPNAGKISVFNNGQDRIGGNYSSIDLIEPPVDGSGNYVIAAGAAYGPTALSWTYEANPPNSFYSSNISGAHFLSNGNVLICDGNEPRFFEVDEQGDLHWEYINPIANNGNPVQQGSNQQTADVFRATRYRADYAGFDGKDMTPGPPIELNPYSSDCEIYDNPSGLDDLYKATFAIYPNPANQEVSITWEGSETVLLKVYDLLGQLINQSVMSNGNETLDINHLANGTYFLTINDLTFQKLVMTR